MRNAFAAEMNVLAEADPRIVLLSGDIGNRMFDSFKEKFPNRFYNCGVAEANMTSMAAGMALCGLKPVTYTITPFNTARCFEQIKIDVCYHKLPVVIVGVGAGLGYANLGPTHHACEDIALMRVLPNMTVICPADAVETRLALRRALEQAGPVYIRLGKKNEPVIHQQQPEFHIGKGIVIRKGQDVCVLGNGTIVPICLQAAELLAGKNISAQVASMHTAKPLDDALLQDAFSGFPLVVAVEEHSLVGGFSASIAEWLVDKGNHCGRFVRFGTPDQFLHSLGNQAQARAKLGLTAENIAARIAGLLTAPGC